MCLAMRSATVGARSRARRRSVSEDVTTPYRQLGPRGQRQVQVDGRRSESCQLLERLGRTGNAVTGGGPPCRGTLAPVPQRWATVLGRRGYHQLGWARYPRTAGAGACLRGVQRRSAGLGGLGRARRESGRRNSTAGSGARPADEERQGRTARTKFKFVNTLGDALSKCVRGAKLAAVGESETPADSRKKGRGVLCKEAARHDDSGENIL